MDDLLAPCVRAHLLQLNTAQYIQYSWKAPLPWQWQCLFSNRPPNVYLRASLTCTVPVEEHKIALLPLSARITLPTWPTGWLERSWPDLVPRRRKKILYTCMDGCIYLTVWLSAIRRTTAAVRPEVISDSSSLAPFLAIWWRPLSIPLNSVIDAGEGWEQIRSLRLFRYTLPLAELFGCTDFLSILTVEICEKKSFLVNVAILLPTFFIFFFFYLFIRGI